MKIIQRAWGLVSRARNARIINTLAGVALGLAVAPLIFANTHEMFSHAAAIGVLAQAISIAYLAGWLINLLVVEIPRQRDASILMGFGGQYVRQMVGVSRAIAMAIMRESGAPLATEDAPITRDDLARAATKLRLYGPAPMYAPRADGLWVRVSWLAFMDDERLRMETLAVPVSRILHLLDPTLMEQVLAYMNHFFWKMVPATLEMGSRRSADLTPLASALSDLLEVGDRVNALLLAF